jgi:hypothetical protein
MEKARESARSQAMKIIQTAALSGDWRAAAEFLKLTFPADYRNSTQLNVTATAQVSGVLVTSEEERMQRIEQRKQLMELRRQLLERREEPPPASS